MRDLSQTPSLFESGPPVPLTEVHSQKEEKGNDRIAREFVKWCFSFGGEFRNSPDIINLRFWTRKAKLKLKEADEAEVLEYARPLFLKRLEQLTKKAEAAAEPAN